MRLAGSASLVDFIADSGGLRKVRFRYGHVGTSGGGRTIDYGLGEATIYRLTAYVTVDQSDLSADDRRMFKALINEMTDGQN